MLSDNYTDGFNGTFTLSSQKDLEWTKTINSQWEDREAYLEAVDKANRGEELTDGDIQALEAYAKNHPNEKLSDPMIGAINAYYQNKGIAITISNTSSTDSNDVTPSTANTILQYLSTIGDVIKGAGGWVMTNGIKTLANITGKITLAVQDGASGFIILNSETRLYKYALPRAIEAIGNGSTLGTIGKVLSNPYTQVLAFGVGVWDDVANKDKTLGQGITHTAASTAVGLGVSALTTAAIGALATNPVGWAALAGAAVGFGAVKLFEWGYDNNFLGMQDKLDAAGDWLDSHVIDQAKETAADVKDWAEDTAGKVGEAVSSGLKSINPFD
ncbi:hypothetical protein [Streptococcus ferus]|uniref:hypothetical protein n=1 Tax=Streptococcus ferus TaxID=1345 RepID=UPI0035A055A1